MIVYQLLVDPIFLVEPQRAVKFACQLFLIDVLIQVVHAVHYHHLHSTQTHTDCTDEMKDCFTDGRRAQGNHRRQPSQQVDENKKRLCLSSHRSRCCQAVAQRLVTCGLTGVDAAVRLELQPW